MAKFLSRNCWYCIPDDFSQSVLSVCRLCLQVTSCQIRWISRPQRMAHYSVPRNVVNGRHWLDGQVRVLLDEQAHIPHPCHSDFNCVTKCPFYLSTIEPENKMDPIILITLMAYHTSILMSCKGTTCINLGLPADQFMLFWVYTQQFQ
jgi:hypothetical protein